MSGASDEFIILGETHAGEVFRPSDWVERLCGVMACFRPDAGPGAHLRFSPYVRPVVLNRRKCVAVDARLRALEPMAHKFLLDFAHDNDLVLIMACVLDESAAPEV